MNTVVLLAACFLSADVPTTGTQVIHEKFDLIEVYYYRYSGDDCYRRHYKFGRILADNSIGIVATQDAYCFEHSNTVDEVVGDGLVVWFDDVVFEEEVEVEFVRRCSSEHYHIYVLPDGRYPPGSHGQLLQGFRNP